MKKGGLGGNVEFWAGSDVVAVLLGIVEQYVSTVETKPYRVSLEQGRVVVGGYTIRFMDETYPNPQDETEWLPKLNPKVLLAVATNQPGKVWYCAIDSISANNAATPLHIVPVAVRTTAASCLSARPSPFRRARRVRPARPWSWIKGRDACRPERAFSSWGGQCPGENKSD